MERTKDRASQMSQGPSNNAILEVTVQLRLQYQELLRLQASQQCVKGMVKTQVCHSPATYSDASTVLPVADSARETVKAQARHTPATCSVFSTIHSGWKKLKAESVPVWATSDKVIIQDGRSDPAAHSFEEFRLADACICLATRSEADEAMREMSLGRGLAILTVNIARVSCCRQRGFGATFSYNSLLAQNRQVWSYITVFKTRWLFAVVKEGFGAPFSSNSLLAQNRQVWSHITDFKELGPVNFCKRRFRCRFCQPAVRPVPSRFVAIARNCQISQGDVSQEFVVSTAHWMFYRK